MPELIYIADENKTSGMVKAFLEIEDCLVTALRAGESCGGIQKKPCDLVYSR